MSMTLVSTVTVGSGGAGNITFSSIPQTGTDLLISFSGRTTPRAATYDGIYVVFNGDTTSANYAVRDLRGSGSAVVSQNWTGFGSLVFDRCLTADTATSNTFSNGMIYISNYTLTTAKSVSLDAVTENNATESWQLLAAGRYSGSSAITSVVMSPNNNWAQYSTASLYTITKGSGGATVS